MAEEFVGDDRLPALEHRGAHFASLPAGGNARRYAAEYP